MTRYETARLADIEMHPETRQLIVTLMANPIVKNATRAGGWIAGGFARCVLSGQSTTDYFNWGRLSSNRPGDVDIFFPSDDIAASVIADQSYSMTKSFGGFAKEASVQTNQGFLQLQLVDTPQLCRPLNESLSQFDFENCQVAIVGDTIHFPQGWHDLERARLLKVVNSNSPFLGSRIVKYIENRGMKGITPDSIPMLSDWIYRTAVTDFPGYSETHMGGFHSAIKNLNTAKMLDPAFLTLFLGKWDVYNKVSSNYGHYETVKIDWALSELGKIKHNRRKVY